MGDDTIENWNMYPHIVCGCNYTFLFKFRHQTFDWVLGKTKVGNLKT